MKRILSALTLCLLSCPAAWSRGQAEEWCLVQDSLDMGRHTFYISHDAVKVVSDRYGYHFVCKAPDWQVHCFRPKEKIEWIARLDLFNGKLCANPFGDPGKNEGSALYTKKTAEAGLSCSVYATKPVSQSVVIGADDIHVDRKVADFLSRLYDIPDCGKVPVYRSDNKGRGGEYLSAHKSFASFDQGKDLRSGVQIELKTLSAKKIPFNASDFALPLGFKRLAGLTSVVYSPTQKESVKETLDSMGFSSATARQKR